MYFSLCTTFTSYVHLFWRQLLALLSDLLAVVKYRSAYNRWERFIWERFICGLLCTQEKSLIVWRLLLYLHIGYCNFQHSQSLLLWIFINIYQHAFEVEVPADSSINTQCISPSVTKKLKCKPNPCPSGKCYSLWASQNDTEKGCVSRLVFTHASEHHSLGHVVKWFLLTREKELQTNTSDTHMAVHTFSISLYTFLYVFLFFCPRMQANSKTPQNKKPETIRIKCRKCRYTSSWQTRQLQNWPLREGWEVVISSKTKYVTFCFFIDLSSA